MMAQADDRLGRAVGAHYRIDSFRFDLMGHQPRAAMEDAAARVDAAAGRDVQLIGEGWNFGEVADGARFVQASQLSLGGSGIGTFSDRARDAVRGGGAGDSGAALRRDQGCSTAWSTAQRRGAASAARPDAAADLVRVGLAGTLRDYRMPPRRHDGRCRRSTTTASRPATRAQPGEVVNYVENHDNQTLFDINALQAAARHAAATTARACRCWARRSTAFSQGVAYFHAGIDMLRSKSLDRNSFDSGDWFNRLDWTYRDNSSAPACRRRATMRRTTSAAPAARAARDQAAPDDIAWTRDAFRDLLRIRASSTLFRLRTRDDVKRAADVPANRFARPHRRSPRRQGSRRRAFPGRAVLPQRVDRSAQRHPARFARRAVGAAPGPSVADGGGPARTRCPLRSRDRPLHDSAAHGRRFRAARKRGRCPIC